MDSRKNLFILSAPSATGKNTVFDALKQKMPLVERAVTATTRKPRSYEKHGVDYYFLTQEQFQQKLEGGAFVEYNLYDKGHYATLQSEIDRYPDTTPLFFILDPNGMKALMQKYPRSTSIFLMPPSIEELFNRIRGRGENTEEEIEHRIQIARSEMEQAQYYHYIIENSDVDETAEKIKQIIHSKMQED